MVRRAAAPHGEHQHAPVGAIVDVADRVGPQKLGLGAGGNFLAHRRDELPGADEMLAGGIVGHVASFNASPRRSKVRHDADAKFGSVTLNCVKGSMHCGWDLHRELAATLARADEDLATQRNGRCGASAPSALTSISCGNKKFCKTTPCKVGLCAEISDGCSGVLAF